MKTPLTVLVLAGLIAGCMMQPAGRSAQSANAAAAENGNRSFEAVTLARTPCFGKCPVYSVTVHADGSVEYDGRRWVAVAGKRFAHANMAALGRLAAMLARKRLPLVVDYRPGKPACGAPVTTDMAGATITVTQGNARRTLYYYQGCPNVPGWLPALAAQIDRAAQSGRWTGTGTEIRRAPSRLRQ